MRWSFSPPRWSLTDYKDAIMEAMYRGTKRNVESEPEEKHGGRVSDEDCLPGFCITAWPI